MSPHATSQEGSQPAPNRGARERSDDPGGESGGLSGNWARLRWVLPLGFLLVYLGLLGVRSLAIPDEARYAEISREMVQSGDWTVPHLLGLRYFEKPIGGYWMNSLSVLAFGENAFAVRLPEALATGVTAWLLLLLARCGTGDERTGLLAALIYLSSLMIFGMGTFAVLDGMLTLSLTAALYAFWRAFSSTGGRGRAGWWAAFGAACGGAFLVKGFVALAIPVAALVPFMLWQRRWRELLLYGSLCVLVAAVVALPWTLSIQVREPDFWNFFFLHEHVQRFAGDDAQHAAPFWLYAPVLLAMSLPWVASLPGALRKGWHSGVRHGEPFHGFLLFAVLMPFLLLSLAKGKLATYVLPCFGPLVILMASAIVEELDRGRQSVLRNGARFNLGLGALGLVAVLAGSFFFRESSYLRENPRAPWLVGLAWVAWIVLATATVRHRVAYIPGTAALLLCALPLLFLRQHTRDALPLGLVERIARGADGNTTLVSGDVGLSPALAWEFKRSNIVLVRKKGEFEYGLGYGDAAGRFIQQQEFASWLAGERVHSPVLLFLSAKPEKALRKYPSPDRMEAEGDLSVFFYDMRPS